MVATGNHEGPASRVLYFTIRGATNHSNVPLHAWYPVVGSSIESSWQVNAYLALPTEGHIKYLICLCALFERILLVHHNFDRPIIFDDMAEVLHAVHHTISPL